MERFQIAILLFVCFVAVGSLSAPQKSKMTVLPETNPYKLEAKGEQFIQDLINNMTLKAKIGQMTQLDISIFLDADTSNGPKLDKTKLAKAVNYGVGSFLNSPFSNGAVGGMNGWNATQWIDVINTIQKPFMALNPSIPMIYGLDSVHGANYIKGAALFPHNIAVASSFNPELAEKAARVAAKDTRTSGVPWAFTPVLGVGVMPLWPRVYETFGEDPYLASVMGTHVVTGIQDNNNFTSPVATSACIKHFLGYPAQKSGKDRSTAWIPERVLRRYFVPPFKAAIDIGAASLMINSGEISGIPVHSSHEVLTDLLRDELQFGGLAVTDYGDIERLHTAHHVAATEREAVKMAIHAGIDMSMVATDYSFPELLLDLVQSGEVTEERIDLSVKRILALKYKLGLFDNPYGDKNNPLISTIGSKEDRQLALDLARESITLIKNEDNILPLSTKYKRVVVTGPCGNSIGAQNGGWSIFWQGTMSNSDFPFGTTIYEGIKSQLGSAGDVSYFEGANFTQLTNAEDAVNAAKNADVVVVCVGEAPEAEIFGDINDLTLSSSQLDLVNQIKTNTNTPIITIVVAARPRILSSVFNQSNAVITPFLPGSEGGQALAEIIFGIVNPSAKLSITYPQFTGDIGVQYYHKYTDPTFPLAEFGTGLSFTTFDYTNLALSTNNLKVGEKLKVSITVRNSGTRKGKEAVLLYVSDLYASVTPEVKMLRRFHKIELGVGESKTLDWTIDLEDLKYIGRDNKPTYELGEFVITIGNQQASFHLVQ